MSVNSLDYKHYRTFIWINNKILPLIEIYLIILDKSHPLSTMYNNYLTIIINNTNELL